MENGNEPRSSVSPGTLLGSPLSRIPINFRTAAIQKETLWAKSFLRWSLILWSSWYSLLILLSDLQKQKPVQFVYISTRVTVIAISIAGILALRSSAIKRTTVSQLSLISGAMYMLSYVSFSYSGLQIRTSWVTVLPATFVILGSWRGSRVLALYLVQISIGLYLFKQPINTIYIVSDLLFGLGIVFGGLIIKNLWMTSVVLQMEKDEADRKAIEQEQKIYQAIETFVPKVLRNKIRSHVGSSGHVGEVLRNISSPQMQHVAILYSDYRNYSQRSSNIEFIKTELMKSSASIVELSEAYDGIVQNRGDSIISGFLDQEPIRNVCRAVLVAALSARNELVRVRNHGRNEPDRYMIVTSGDGVFCNLAGGNRNEVTIAGKPANLAARIDEITKHESIRSHLRSEPVVLLDFETKKTLASIGAGLDFFEIDLSSSDLGIRSYIEERRVYVLGVTENCVKYVAEKLNESVDEHRSAA